VFRGKVLRRQGHGQQEEKQKEVFHALKIGDSKGFKKKFVGIKKALLYW
jgi:hypothetical protein